jgi:hypothetical protein
VRRLAAVFAESFSCSREGPRSSHRARPDKGAPIFAAYSRPFVAIYWVRRQFRPPMSKFQDHLVLADRHIAEAERRVARLAEIVEEMSRDNHPAAADRGREIFVLSGDIGDHARARPQWLPPRCCGPAVKLLAIELTLSVRSFQTPLTSRTCARPPSLPSVPTSRATRVKHAELLDHRIDDCSGPEELALQRSPKTSKLTVWRRSPWATAVMA